MASEIKEETQERFKACPEIPGRWLYSEAGQRGSRDVMFPGDRQMMYKKYLAFLKTLSNFQEK